MILILTTSISPDMKAPFFIHIKICLPRITSNRRSRYCLVVLAASNHSGSCFDVMKDVELKNKKQSNAAAPATCLPDVAA